MTTGTVANKCKVTPADLPSVPEFPGVFRSRKNSATTPPPTESCRLVAITKRLNKFNDLNLAALHQWRSHRGDHGGP